MWIIAFEARNNMHVKVRLMLSATSAVVLKDVHSPSIKGSGGCARDLLHKTVDALDLIAPNVQNGLAMISWNDEHCPAFVLTLVDFGYCVLVLGNNRTFSRAGEVVAEAAG